MHESDYISAVNKYLPVEVYRWKIHDSFTSGVPDAYYSGMKSDLWIEYKLLRNVPNKHTPKLSPLQKKWLREQYHKGRKVAVIIGFKGGKGVIVQDLEWESQITVNNLLSKKELADWITNQTN